MTQLLQTENLSASYSKKLVLNQVFLNLKRGDFACLCGPNGSGKSTLLSIMAGINSPELKINSGTISLINMQREGCPLSSLSRKEIATHIAWMQQDEFSTWNFSAFDYVLSGRYCHTQNGWYSKEDKEITENILCEMEMIEYKDRNIHQLSGGEFQKLRIARALCQEPEFMLLDEPAASLDFIYEPKLLELLKTQAKKKNIGILITIHDINAAARYAEQMILLPPRENAICGTVDKVFTSENLQKTFGVNLQTYMHPIFNQVQAYEKK